MTNFQQENHWQIKEQLHRIQERAHFVSLAQKYDAFPMFLSFSLIYWNRSNDNHCACSVCSAQNKKKIPISLKIVFGVYDANKKQSRIRKHVEASKRRRKINPPVNKIDFDQLKYSFWRNLFVKHSYLCTFSNHFRTNIQFFHDGWRRRWTGTVFSTIWTSMEGKIIDFSFAGYFSVFASHWHFLCNFLNFFVLFSLFFLLILRFNCLWKWLWHFRNCEKYVFG